jgi:integrase
MMSSQAVQLNEAVVKSLRVPERGSRIHYFPDAVLQGTKAPRGFGVRITANGVRSFIINYRVAHQERRYTIGQYPDWSVLRAVKEARELRQRIDRGEDPLDDRRKQESATENAFKAICEEFFRRDGARLRTKGDREDDLRRLAYPKLGNKPIEDIRRTDVIRLLDDVADNNGLVMADRLLAYMRRVMNWHASRSDTYNSPIVRGMARTKGRERARERILTDDEVRAVWRAAEASPTPYTRLLRFILLTGARRAEAAEMARQELDGAIWTLPAARNKTKQDLARPLTEQALEILPERAGEFVFSTGGGYTPIGGFSKFKLAFDETCGVKGWTVHDLRRTARTLMSRAGVPADVAERCLGHVLPGVRGTYDRHQYLPEMRRAYEALASLLDRIVNPPADNVTAIAQRRAKV